MRSKDFKILKSGGYPENFSKRKLFMSLQRAGLPKRQCQTITDKISNEISEGTNTKRIFRKTLTLVNQTSSVAAINYSLKRAIFDLGPTGHHFETFVARYFKQLGYETKTCQSVPGLYVNHEIDVVATKGKTKSFVECKFHNRAGIKNDIKIALYVKARWDDLKNGPNGKNLEAFYLATNTAFSSDAITYAAGSGLHLMGVNAPVDKPFIEEIKKLNLYPVTSLRRINKYVKNELLMQNIILARELPGEVPFLRELGLGDDEIKSVLNEVDLLLEKKL
jgi:Restriction endonuclease